MIPIRSRIVKNLRRAAGCLLLVFGNLCPALAQAPKPPASEPIPDEVDRLLWDRGREILHPADPLDLVGVEEGGNDFRSRTPLLEQSDRAVARVDVEENRLRRLAMYAEGRSFHVPLLATAGIGVNAPGARSSLARSANPTSKAADGGAEDSSWLLLLLLPGTLAMILVGLVWARYRGLLAR